MTDDGTKQLDKTLKDGLKLINGEISRIHSEISKLQTVFLSNNRELKNISNDISRIDSELESIRETLEEHTEKLDNNSGALIEIESTLKGYGDMYTINKDEIERIKKHINLPSQDAA